MKAMSLLETFCDEATGLLGLVFVKYTLDVII
jgi:hypothetical protein